MSVAETLLLFSIAVPPTGDAFSPRAHQIVALIVGFLIPGLAVIFSCLNYGFPHWQRRAFIIVGLPILAFCSFVGVIWGAGELLQDIPYERQDRVAIGMFSVILLVILWLVSKGWKISRRRSVDLEAQHWLDERNSGATNTEVVQRHRLIRTALWIPAATVLLALLFLPETWALVSHIVHGGSRRLNAYTVSVPVTWVVLMAGDRSLSGVVAPGLALHPTQWLHGEVPISSWGFSVYNTPRPHIDSSQIIERQDFLVKDSTITCVRYWPNRWEAGNGRRVRIDCSGPHGFFGYMEGQTRDVASFFAVLGRTG